MGMLSDLVVSIGFDGPHAEPGNDALADHFAADGLVAFVFVAVLDGREIILNIGEFADGMFPLLPSVRGDLPEDFQEEE